jgi:putative peptidoglycan lipid II flippase
VSTESQETKPATTRLSSTLVGAGILLSRLTGLIRTRLFGQYLGASLYADVFTACIRMPNVLQNLLGEGTLSASFIPVYSELLEQGRKEEAGRTAGAIFGLLAALAGFFALIGILLAPFLVRIFLPGFEGERRELSIEVVQIIFPMTGILVLSAWALGILNSHRKFFISYVAPVVWNGAMIATLILFGGRVSPDRLVVALAWGALIGGVLQFAVQLPWLFRLERQLKPSLNLRLAPVRETIRNAGPAIAGRGVVQLSGWVDLILASLLASGAVAVIGYAQTLYILPVSLFGMSVAAAELPELSRQRTGATEELRARTNAALERIAFFVVPSFVAFVLLGDALVAMVFQVGAFDRTETLLVYLTLMGFSIGLLASTSTRLFSSTFFALRDTKTPARYAIFRVILAASLGFLLMVQFEPVPAQGISTRFFNIPAGWLDWGLLTDVTIDGQTLGAVGLAAGSGVAAWVEWTLLRRRLRERIGPVGAPNRNIGLMFAAAVLAALVGWVVRLSLPPIHPFFAGFLIFSAFGITYFVSAALFRLREAELIRDRLLRLIRR